KNVAALLGRVLQIGSLCIGGVEAVGKTGGQLIETAANAGNLLVANLDQPGQASTRQRAGDVVGPRHDVLYAAAAKLGGECEILRSGYQRRPVRSGQRDALTGRNHLHIDQRGKLLDEIVL